MREIWSSSLVAPEQITSHASKKPFFSFTERANFKKFILDPNTDAVVESVFKKFRKSKIYCLFMLVDKEMEQQKRPFQNLRPENLKKTLCDYTTNSEAKEIYEILKSKFPFEKMKAYVEKIHTFALNIFLSQVPQQVHLLIKEAEELREKRMTKKEKQRAAAQQLAAAAHVAAQQVAGGTKSPAKGASAPEVEAAEDDGDAEMVVLEQDQAAVQPEKTEEEQAEEEEQELLQEFNLLSASTDQQKNFFEENRLILKRDKKKNFTFLLDFVNVMGFSVVPVLEQLQLEVQSVYRNVIKTHSQEMEDLQVDIGRLETYHVFLITKIDEAKSLAEKIGIQQRLSTKHPNAAGAARVMSDTLVQDVQDAIQTGDGRV
ncbi:unnamed protein product, partial [Amoebophrya sp. A120]|eukprot:GSA120T00009022001.1